MVHRIPTRIGDLTPSVRSSSRGHRFSTVNWTLALDNAVDTAQNNISPFQPLITTATGAIEQTAIAKSITDGIGKFFEEMPIFMNALDAVADLHPFIGGMSTRAM